MPDVSVCLNHLLRHIEYFITQYHPSFQSDEHKTQSLRNVVSEGIFWSVVPIRSINILMYTYKMFATALHE